MSTDDFSASALSAFRRKLDDLITVLEAHPQMTRTPATDAPKALYFTWDFVRRTDFLASEIDITALAAKDPVALEAFQDCLGRAMLADKIIGDETGETCRSITFNEPVDFGPEVRAKSKAVVED